MEGYFWREEEAGVKKDRRCWEMRGGSGKVDFAGGQIVAGVGDLRGREEAERRREGFWREWVVQVCDGVCF